MKKQCDDNNQIKEIIKKEKIDNKIYYYIIWKGQENKEPAMEPLTKLKKYKKDIKKFENQLYKKSKLSRKREGSKSKKPKTRKKTTQDMIENELFEVNKSTNNFEANINIHPYIKVTHVELKDDILMAKIGAFNHKNEVQKELDFPVSSLRETYQDLLLNYFIAKQLKDDKQLDNNSTSINLD